MMGSKAQDIKRLMQEWFDEKPGTRDTTLLAKKTGLDYNTVRRIWTGGNPECQSALALLNVITSKDRAIGYLKEHFPQAAAFHKREYTTDKFYADAEELRPVIDDLMSFVIMNLAYAGHANREYIARKYGEEGLEAVDNLVASERIRLSGSQLLPTRDEAFFSYEGKADLIKVCDHVVRLSVNAPQFHGFNRFPPWFRLRV